MILQVEVFNEICKNRKKYKRILNESTIHIKTNVGNMENKKYTFTDVHGIAKAFNKVFFYLHQALFYDAVYLL